MFYVTYEKISEEKASVVQYANLDYMPKPESKGFEIESIPAEPQPPIGKEIRTFVNPKTKEFFYEYTDRPLTTEEKLEISLKQNEKLSERLDSTENALLMMMDFNI